MSAGLKTGLNNGVGVILINLIGLIPVAGPCIALLLYILAYLGAGVLVVNYTGAPLDTGEAAKLGALAAVVAAFVGGIVNTIISLIRTTTGGLSEAARYLNQLPPEFRDQIPDLDSGVGLLAGLASGFICSSVCCLFGIAIAAALGAAGAAVYASVKKS